MSDNVLFSGKCDRYDTLGEMAAGTDRNFEVTSLFGDNKIQTTLISSSGLRTDSLMDASKVGIYVHLRRQGGDALDTSTRDISVYGIEIIYNEVKRVVGEFVKK